MWPPPTILLVVRPPRMRRITVFAFACDCDCWEIRRTEHRCFSSRNNWSAENGILSGLTDNKQNRTANNNNYGNRIYICMKYIYVYVVCVTIPILLFSVYCFHTSKRFLLCTCWRIWRLDNNIPIRCCLCFWFTLSIRLRHMEMKWLILIYYRWFGFIYKKKKL